ncbi:MAG TPA: HIT domain-containing protein [bacterium]|nr:HIT domain-containing protein [bacterium]
MKILSAGWRMAYIKRGDAGGCIFCESGGKGRAGKRFIVLRGTHAFVMMNRYPYTTGHLMVAPYRHVGSVEGLTDAEACEVIRLVGRCEAAIRKAMRPDGFNIGANLGKCAGAGYPGHFHVHVVPRWNGDTNFMPVLSETKVLPETLTATYRKIVKAIESLDAGRSGKRR